MGRLKTGTPPRLDAASIDFSRTEAQWGDEPPPPFSYSTDEIRNPQLPCYITYTNPVTHKIISENLDRSPLYCGRIKGLGPRYCPSIEDKVVRFSHRDRHQVFLEPEGLRSGEYYANGISTSLPQEVQVKLVRSIPALEEAEITRPGYAIEYDYVFPTQVRHTLETKLVEGLYLAGQINGTSGYEEAAAQGLVAGVNASMKILNQKPLELGRHEAYIGVLIDDLVTKGTSEPYRMFTSRAEYRLLLRHDNADLRLRHKGRGIGLVGDDEFDRFRRKKEAIASELKRIEMVKVRPEAANPALEEAGTTPINEPCSLAKLLKRPEVGYSLIERISPPETDTDNAVKEQVEIETRYAGYIKRQMDAAAKLRKSESMKIPSDFDYAELKGLSSEVLAKLREVRPENLGQAGRIPGVTPAALTLIMLTLKRESRLAGR
jgi:tRNA uridine 5-carboxymethylaminomethyl modification enzyme